jgi:hypothetical protein
MKGARNRAFFVGRPSILPRDIRMPDPAKKRRRWFAWAACGVAAFLVLFVADSFGLGALSIPIFGYSAQWKSHYLAGIRSVDCGWVKLRADASKATACALDANAKGKPFRVIYQIQGFDAIVAGGIVRTPSGKLLALSYDSCPSGCGFSFLQQRTTVASCPEPYKLYVNPKERLNCFQQQLSPPHDIMSPNAEPY